MLNQFRISEKHKLLFRLRYVEKGLREPDLLKLLKVTEQELIIVGKELDQHLIGLLKGVVTPERIEMVCQDCVEGLLISDVERDEVVCVSCGSVRADLTTPDESLPFDMTFKPTSDLATDKSLGTPALTKSEQYELQKRSGSSFVSLSKFSSNHSSSLIDKLTLDGIAFDNVHAYLLADEGNRVYITNLKDIATYVLNKQLVPKEEMAKLFHMNDLPLRFNRIRVLSSAENPELNKLLREGFKLSTQYGMDKDYVFNNNLGKNIRRAFSLAHELKIKVPMRMIAGTCFYYTLCHGNKLQGQVLKLTLKAKYDDLIRSDLLYTLLSRYNGMLLELKKEAGIKQETVLELLT